MKPHRENVSAGIALGWHPSKRLLIRDKLLLIAISYYSISLLRILECRERAEGNVALVGRVQGSQLPGAGACSAVQTLHSSFQPFFGRTTAAVFERWRPARGASLRVAFCQTPHEERPPPAGEVPAAPPPVLMASVLRSSSRSSCRLVRVPEDSRRGRRPQVSDAFSDGLLFSPARS